MKIILKPLGYLKNYFKDHLDKGQSELGIFIEKDNITVSDLLKNYNFDMDMVGHVLCGDNIVNLEYMLQDGDRIVVMMVLSGG